MNEQNESSKANEILVGITHPKQAFSPTGETQVAIPMSTTTPAQPVEYAYNPKHDLIIKNRILCFGVTYLAYAVIHATRTAWSSSKQSLNKELGEDDSQFLGVIDTFFLLSYAISMKLMGSYSRGISINYLLGFGMISASVCLLAIYFVCQVRINKSFILLMMIANGISQSTGWPSVVACMGNWFGTGSKGLLMGIWATSGNFGNMVGYFIQDFIVNALDLNWTFVLFIVGMLLLIIGSLIVFHLNAYPAKLDISREDLNEFDQMVKHKQQQKQQQDQELSQSQQQAQSQQIKQASPEKRKKAQKTDHVEFNDEQIDPEEEEQNDHDRQTDDTVDNSTFKRNDTIRLERLNIAVSDEEASIGMQNSQQHGTNDNQSQGNPQNGKVEREPAVDVVDNENNREIGNVDSSISEQNINADVIYGSPDALSPTESLQVTTPATTGNAVSAANSADQQQIQRTNSLSSEPITYFNAWTRVPGLAMYALTQGGVKGTVYGIMFWMPIYLQEHGLKQQAAWICSMNEIGTFAGGLILGYLIDRFAAFRATLITSLLAISSIVMLVIHLLPVGVAAPYYCAALLAGMCLGGPYTLLGGAIAIDLAQQPKIREHKNITALLAGIIEGFGSFVAAIVQIVIPMFGQENIFLLFTLSSFFSSFFLLQKAKEEVKTAFLWS